MRKVGIALAVLAICSGFSLAAWADNQQIAEQIAAHLRNSGQLHGYRIAVKFQDGTAWLRGRVSSPEQMRLALQLAAQVPGVQRVENELTVAPPEPIAGSVADNGGKLVNPFGHGGVQPASGEIPAPVLQPAPSAMGPEQSPRPIGLSSLGLGAAAAAVPRSEPAPERIQPYSEGIARVAGVQTGPRISSPDQLAMASKYVDRYQEPPAAPATLQPIPMPQSSARPIGTARSASSNSSRAIPLAMAPAGEGSAPAATPVPTHPVAGSPIPVSGVPISAGVSPVRYDQPHLPNYAWPSYAAYPNYAAVTYPKQYSPTAWPYIGPFYPYPQVPLGWRKVTLEWHDGWWWLDFDDGVAAKPFNGLFRLK
ncbi:MAG: BON domain-containing protein [Thermoguttaceae bacterium]|nr:BON domain-containing protein [Thermoguttaceae bacterium]MDW8039118.1 BON domain-containing protein [Thermoguttaceae bacterium]